jgi:hypothetical protein
LKSKQKGDGEGHLEKAQGGGARLLLLLPVLPVLLMLALLPLLLVGAVMVVSGTKTSP